MTNKELLKQTIIELLKEDEGFRNEIAQAVFNHNDFCEAVGNAQYEYEREQDRAEAIAWT